MDFNIDSFTARLMELLKDNAPYESDEINNEKHPKRKGRHLKDLFDKDKQTITLNLDMRTFDVGSPMDEALMPQYHILQQAEVIRKRGRGTKTSKGSQDEIGNTLDRDYEKVKWNGKTFSKEYSKNVRGERSKARKLLEPKLRYVGGKYVEDMRGGLSNIYVNKHYQYIDRILDAVVPYLAQEFELRAMRKQDSGLQEEYDMQKSEEDDDRFSILDTLNSFEY